MKITMKQLREAIFEIVQRQQPTFPDKFVHKVEEEVTEEMLEDILAVLPIWEAGEHEQVEALIRDLHTIGRNQLHNLMNAAEEFKNYGQISDNVPESVIDYFEAKFSLESDEHPNYYKLKESISLDIEEGDVILTGKYKNKRKIVKTIGTDDLGQPTVNGKSILKFKIEKDLPQEKWSAKSREELENKKSTKMTESQLRCIIKEALTKTDIKDIERISRKEAKSEIEKVVGRDLSKTIQEEVAKVLKKKATKEEIGDITKSVIKRLYRSLAMEKSHVIDQIKVK